MGYFDDIDPPDSAFSYFATPLGVPRITVRPNGFEPPPGRGNAPTSADASDETNSSLLTRAGLLDDIVAPVARHKAAIERALSATVPLRLQHPHAVEIAAGLMADHGMPLDEALDRATMRLHAAEGTAQAGKISDVIGKDAFDEAQRAPAPPDFAQPAPGVGLGRASTDGQARPDGEHASGDSAPQGGEAAGGKTIGSEGAGPTDDRARSYGPAARVAREGLSAPAPEPASLLSRLASPVTDIPHEIYEAGAELLGTVNAYLNPFSDDYRKGLEAERDKWVGIGPGSFLGTGKGLLAAAGVPFSPITGTFRSLIGHPLSVITPTATPEQQERMRQAGVSEDMIPGQTREENYQKVKRKVDLAMMALRGFTPRGPIPRAGPQPPARPPDPAAPQSDRMTSGARESGPSSLEGKEDDALPTTVFSPAELRVIGEAKSIMASPQMLDLAAAHGAGESLTVTIGGRLVQYEPGLPASGMTMFGDSGFFLGPEAFSSNLELSQTVLHELHRLNFSNSAGGVSADLAARETHAAASFAARSAKQVP